MAALACSLWRATARARGASQRLPVMSSRTARPRQPSRGVCRVCATVQQAAPHRPPLGQLMLGWLRPRPLLVVGFVGVLCAALGYVALSGVSATAFQAVAYMVIKPFFPALVATNMKSSIDKGWETGTTLDAIMALSCGITFVSVVGVLVPACLLYLLYKRLDSVHLQEWTIEQWASKAGGKHTVFTPDLIKQLDKAGYRSMIDLAVVRQEYPPYGGMQFGKDILGQLDYLQLPASGLTVLAARLAREVDVYRRRVFSFEPTRQ